MAVKPKKEKMGRPRKNPENEPRRAAIRLRLAIEERAKLLAWRQATDLTEVVNGATREKLESVGLWPVMTEEWKQIEAEMKRQEAEGATPAPPEPKRKPRA